VTFHGETFAGYAEISSGSRQRLAELVGLEVGLLLPKVRQQAAAGLDRLGGGRLRAHLRPQRHAAHLGRGRQDHQDVPRGRLGGGAPFFPPSAILPLLLSDGRVAPRAVAARDSQEETILIYPILYCYC